MVTLFPPQAVEHPAHEFPPVNEIPFTSPPKATFEVTVVQRKILASVAVMHAVTFSVAKK